MSKKKEKKQMDSCNCTPNCIYFQQEVPKDQIIHIQVENGILMRTVRRDCLYDNTQIKSWNHTCGRGKPHYAIKEKGECDSKL